MSGPEIRRRGGGGPEFGTVPRSPAEWADPPPGLSLVEENDRLRRERDDARCQRNYAVLEVERLKRSLNDLAEAAEVAAQGGVHTPPEGQKEDAARRRALQASGSVPPGQITPQQQEGR